MGGGKGQEFREAVLSLSTVKQDSVQIWLVGHGPNDLASTQMQIWDPTYHACRLPQNPSCVHMTKLCHICWLRSQADRWPQPPCPELASQALRKTQKGTDFSSSAFVSTGFSSSEIPICWTGPWAERALFLRHCLSAFVWINSSKGCKE